jgi:uncharacterized protein with PQ loop repeat
MLAQTAFSFARASVQQEVAFVAFSIFTIGFFIWLALLARRK